MRNACLPSRRFSLKFKTTKDYKDILNNPAIDAVVVAVPTNFHFKITQEALQAGKHVLCEKPLAMLAEECLQLGDLAKSVGKILMTGHIFVFNQGIVKLREYIASGEMGKIHYAHSDSGITAHTRGAIRLILTLVAPAQFWRLRTIPETKSVPFSGKAARSR